MTLHWTVISIELTQQ